MTTLTIDQAFQQALTHHRVGELPQAEQLYHAILQNQPNHPDANHNLGIIAVAVNHPELALPFFKLALETNPNQAQFWLSYIDALIKTKQFDLARAVLIQGKESYGLQGDAVDALTTTLFGLYNTAIELRESGRYSEAIDWLKSYLVQNPQDADAYAHLAQNFLLNKQDDDAWNAMNHALAINSASILVQRNHARLLLKQQKIVEARQIAEAIYQTDSTDVENQAVFATTLAANNELEPAKNLCENVLKRRPNYAEVLAILGQIYWKTGDKNTALQLFENALSIKPHLVQLYPIVVAFHNENKNLSAAIATLKKALEYEPNEVRHMVYMGELLGRNYQAKEAIQILEKAVKIVPENANAWANLGTAFQQIGELEKAKVAYEKILEINPKQAEVAHNLGVLMMKSESYEAALPYFEMALAEHPNHPEFLASKGNVLLKLNRPLQEIEAIGNKILEVAPNSDASFRLLAKVNESLGMFDQACNFLQEAVKRNFNFALNHYLLGGMLLVVERHVEAEASLINALQLDPNYVDAFARLLFIHNHRSEHTPEFRLTEAKRFGELVNKKVKHRFSNWQCESQPKRLRIGFVSGDFRSHVVSYFLENTLRELQPLNCELIAYSTSHQTDEVTERIKPYFSDWKPIFGLSDEAAATLIHNDGVHILVDLSGHTGHNRLPLFAWKPAQIQVTWLGYFATTGVAEMDYILGDSFVTPTEEAHFFTEKVWQLPDSYLCFTPPNFAIDITPLPALENGFITFGCFNNLTKMNDTVVELWARVLNVVPNSKLFLKSKQLHDKIICEKTCERFAAHGIESKRLILEGSAPREELLKSYQRVDIALDPFPYPGGTTSVESLWMAVPVLTLRGDCFLSHVGESIAHNAGLKNWIAADADDYVAKAVSFTNDVQALAELRQGLRTQVLNSPIFDAERFAKNFETAMWEMWREYSIHN